MTSMTIGSEPTLQARPSAIQLRPTGRDLARALAAEMGVGWNQIIGREKHKDIVRARQSAQWILIREAKLPLTQIGRMFGRDHTTVIHSRRVIDRDIASDPAFATEIADLLERALARWRKRRDHADNQERLPAAPVWKAEGQTPARRLKPYQNGKAMERPSHDDETTRRASARLLELLREHHPEMEIRKPQ